MSESKKRMRELNHVGIRCGNIRESVRFYRDVLGGVVIRDNTIENYRTVYIQLAEGVVELIKSDRSEGYVHLAFLSDRSKGSIETLAQELTDQGFSFLIPPRKAGSGDGKIAFYQDESGAVFEMLEREENIRVPNLTNPCLRHFCCTLIACPQERAVKCDQFYLQWIGMEKTGNYRYSMGANAVQLSPQLLPTGNPIQALCFQVDDLEKLRTRFLVFDVPAEKVRDFDHGKAFTVTGPDGELLIFSDFFFES